MNKLLLCAAASTLAIGLAACEPASSPESTESQAAETQSAQTESTAHTIVDATAEQPTTIPAPADVAAPPADAKVLESGLAYKMLQAGTGTVHPKLTDTVVVHYTGWTTDGEMFDSSVVRGKPATFPLGQLIKGWQQGIPLMVAGEKTRFWIPGELAYANSSRPGAPKGMLVFDVELIAIK